MHERLGITRAELEHQSGVHDVLTESEKREGRVNAYLQLYIEVLLEMPGDAKPPSQLAMQLAMAVAEAVWRFQWTARSSERFEELVEKNRTFEGALRAAYESAHVEHGLRELYIERAHQAYRLAEVIRAGMGVEDDAVENVVKLRRRRAG